MSCNNCKNDTIKGYDFCKECIPKLVRICTCEKKFITGKPEIFLIPSVSLRQDQPNGTQLVTHHLPDPIPDFFFTQLKGNIYHIFGCRGCESKKRGEEISVSDNFEQALQASIVSCVYQKVEENGNTFYEYLSDALDHEFEDYLEKNGIKVGEVIGI